jgi:hypothetical protein
MNEDALRAEYNAAWARMSDMRINGSCAIPLSIRTEIELRYRRASRALINAGLMYPLKTRYDPYREK